LEGREIGPRAGCSRWSFPVISRLLPFRSRSNNHPDGRPVIAPPKLAVTCAGTTAARCGIPGGDTRSCCAIRAWPAFARVAPIQPPIMPLRPADGAAGSSVPRLIARPDLSNASTKRRALSGNLRRGPRPRQYRQCSYLNASPMIATISPKRRRRATPCQ
jgi:hypothetical protein